MPGKIALLHNKKALVGISIGGAGVAGYLIYRAHKTKTAAAATTASSGYGYGTASTGYGYGSSQYGYGEPVNGYGAGYYGYGGSGGFGSGGGNAYYGYGVGTPPTAPQATTNAGWSQAAIKQLQHDGYHANNAAGALGVYITGRQPTAEQRKVIDAAIAIEGYPPVAGPNDFPPNVKSTSGGGGGGQNLGGGGGGSSTGSDKVDVPDVVGRSYAQSVALLKAKGLKAERNGPGKIVQQRPAANTKVDKGSTVVLFGANK